MGHRWRARIGAIGAAAALAAALTGCGSGPPSASPAAIVHEVRSILVPRRPTPEGLDAVTASAAAVTLAEAADRLRALPYPPDARAPAEALVVLLQKLSIDDAELALTIRHDPADVGARLALAGRIMGARRTEVADADALLHRLGLAPVTTST